MIIRSMGMLNLAVVSVFKLSLKAAFDCLIS